MLVSVSIAAAVLVFNLIHVEITAAPETGDITMLDLQDSPVATTLDNELGEEKPALIVGLIDQTDAYIELNEDEEYATIPTFTVYSD